LVNCPWLDQRRSQAPLNPDPELMSDGWSSVLSLQTAVGRYSPGASATRRQYLLRLQILTGTVRPVPSPVLTGTQREVWIIPSLTDVQPVPLILTGIVRLVPSLVLTGTQKEWIITNLTGTQRVSDRYSPGAGPVPRQRRYQ